MVCRTGCIGFCAEEPLLDLMLPNGPRVSYGRMTAEKTRRLLKAYAGGNLLLQWALGRFSSEEHLLTQEVHQYPAGPQDLASVPEWSTLDFYRRQKKVILRSCGSIDPLRLDEAIARGAYRGALRAIGQMKPEEVIEEMVQSGLRGRGGAAFPTGQKWRFARQAPGDLKYLVCNADEGAPGSYMDRTVLEGDPHAILEGMLIGSYAIGAGKDSSTSAANTRWPSPRWGTLSPRRKNAACWATTFSAAAGRSACRCAAGRGPTCAARRRP